MKARKDVRQSEFLKDWTLHSGKTEVPDQQGNACRDGQSFPLKFSMAFQPIVNVTDGTIHSHEGLVRGAAGEGAGTVLSIVDDKNRYSFDQQCRVKAIELAAQLFPAVNPPRLSINFMANVV